jgi:hypothetical protein
MQLPVMAIADECPGHGASLTAVINAISDFRANDRAPAGADCAYGWAINYPLDPSNLDSTETLRFLYAAADIERTAAEKRYGEQRKKDGDRYLDHEVELRKNVLKAALVHDSAGSSTKDLNRFYIRNLSYLISALELHRQYDVVAEDLGDQDPAVIDDEALKVWLRAVWSCARWDGQKNNLCPDRDKCKEKVNVFLDSVNEMKNRRFSPRTKKDIAALKNLAENGCLK